MPGDYALGNKAVYVQAIKNSLPMYSRDGRFEPRSGETAHAVLKAVSSIPPSPTPAIHVPATYTNEFVDRRSLRLTEIATPPNPPAAAACPGSCRMPSRRS